MSWPLIRPAIPTRGSDQNRQPRLSWQVGLLTWNGVLAAFAAIPKAIVWTSTRATPSGYCLVANLTRMIPQRWDSLAQDISCDVARIADGNTPEAVSTRRRSVIEAVRQHTSDPQITAAVVLAHELWETAAEAGDLTVLKDAVDVLEDLSARLPEEQELRDQIVLPNLCVALTVRARETGSRDDDVRLIDIARYLVSTAPERGDHAFTLIDALRRRFADTGNLAWISESIEVAAAWAQRTSDDPQALVMLSGLLMVRFQKAADPDDLDRAIQAGRLAVARLQVNAMASPDVLLMAKINLAQSLHQRFLSAGNTADLDDALALYSELAPQLSAESPDYPELLNNFGMVLLKQFDRTGTSQLLDEAVRVGRLAVAASGGIDKAQQTIIRAALRRSLSRRYEEQRDPGDLDELMRLDVVAVGLEADTPPREAHGLTGRRIDRWMRLASQWDELVTEVRELPGFGDFLMAPRFDTLRRAAEGGPIVMLNAGLHRCDAVVVQLDRAEPVALENLTIDSATHEVRRYLRTIWDYQQACQTEAIARARITDGANDYRAFQAYDQARTAAVEQRKHMETTLTDITEWMWYAVGRPVVDALGTPPGGDNLHHRLWWCPIGLLSFLPIHAAGLHTRAGGETILDNFISSYTPSLRALLEARARTPEESEPGDVLLVAVPNAAGAAPLLKVDDETAMLRDLLSGCFALRAGEAATRKSVLEALQVYGYAHFSCHGLDNPFDPRQAGVQMYDGLLSVRDIAAARFRGQFAFLSACTTASSVSHVPDEALNLASALHHAGYRHVVATQWSVYDGVALEMSRRFYAAATDGGRLVPDRAAIALHSALKELRDLHPARPSVWAPYVHIGP